MKASLEFFAGGGMARLGFGPDWQCTFANDVSRAKERAYTANFGRDHLPSANVKDVTIADLPSGRADCVWISRRIASVTPRREIARDSTRSSRAPSGRHGRRSRRSTRGAGRH